MNPGTASESTPAGAGGSPAAGSDPIERLIPGIAADLLAAQPRTARAPLRGAEDRMMSALANRPGVRAALFRLVDVAPACRGDRDLAEHLVALLAEARGGEGAAALGPGGADGSAPPENRRAAGLGALERLARVPGGRRIAARGARLAIRRMAHRFIIGESPRAATATVSALWRRGIAVSLDLLGEMTVTAREADRYAERCLTAIDELATASRSWPVRSRHEGERPSTAARANLSVKVTALTPALRPHSPERGIADARPRLRELLRAARERGAHLHIDMESFDSRDAVLELVLELLAEPEFSAGPAAGLVLQAYLADAADQLDQVLEWSARAEREPPLTIRLVKGAYWDHEVIEAGLHGWGTPVLTAREATDHNFELLTRRLVDSRDLVRTAVASHNLRSVAHAIAYCRATGAGEHAIELQILRGLGDGLGHALAARGLRVRSYCPVGDLVAGMAYLVRRLLENSSNDSFLVQRARGRELDALLRAPQSPSDEWAGAGRPGGRR